MRVLVCGSRYLQNVELVFRALEEFRTKYPITLIIEGGQTGADRIARSWAIAVGMPFQTFNADWTRYGDGAGPIRNGQMIREGKPDAVVAFPSGKGTGNMIKLTQKAGIFLRRVRFVETENGLSFEWVESL